MLSRVSNSFWSPLHCLAFKTESPSPGNPSVLDNTQKTGRPLGEEAVEVKGGGESQCGDGLLCLSLYTPVALPLPPNWDGSWEMIGQGAPGAQVAPQEPYPLPGSASTKTQPLLPVLSHACYPGPTPTLCARQS